VKVILDMIAEADIILSGGHLHITEIFKVFEEAKKRGVKRLLVNHPTFIVDASHDDIRQLVSMGAYIEHSLCMFIPVGNRPKSMLPIEELGALIQAAGVDATILASDMGQKGIEHPVIGFRNVIKECIRIGYGDEDIRKMVATNPLRLLGLDD
jgi:microsomal dipeptidase-like Zn-dependent dipeptidase